MCLSRHGQGKVASGKYFDCGWNLDLTLPNKDGLLKECCLSQKLPFGGVSSHGEKAIAEFEAVRGNKEPLRSYVLKTRGLWRIGYAKICVIILLKYH